MTFKPPSRAASTLTLGIMLLVATTIGAQQLSGPKSESGKTARLVCDLIESQHINQPKIDDDVSAKLLKRFLKDLDPQKLYFTRSDVDELDKYKRELDDLVKVGNVDFAFNTFDKYLKRLDERVELAHKWIDAKHDFTADESLLIDADKQVWAKSDEEISERWRKRIKLDLVSLKLEDTPLEKARGQLHKRYKNIKRMMHQTEDYEKLEIYLSALAHCFDPHSSYMSPQTLEDFQIQMRLSLEGIGAALRSEYGFTIVAQIVPGGAADKDGRLKVGDKIIGVGQEQGEMIDVVEMKLSKVVRFIRGPKATKVRLKVKTADAGDVKVYELTRQKIELKSAEVKGEIIETADRLKGRQARIGIINVPSFYRDFTGAQQGLDDFKSTARDVLSVLMDFRAKGGVDAIVVDLRTDGGGALSEAIEVSGLFIDKGPVVQVKAKDGGVKSHNDPDAGAAYSGPLVVVCNRLSASASEIFAGVIKDYGRGIIVGDTTTHGKGTVQNVMPVGRRLFPFVKSLDRGALKLTINQFYRVNGASTQEKGVPSDIVLPSLLDHMDLGESFLDNALKFNHVKPAKHLMAGMVTSEWLSQLRKSSQRRVDNDPKFKEVREEIQKYLARKNRKTVSLNEETLRKERADDKKKKDENKDAHKKNENGNGPIFPDNHYNNEILQIAVDYLSLVKGLQTAKN